MACTQPTSAIPHCQEIERIERGEPETLCRGKVSLGGTINKSFMPFIYILSKSVSFLFFLFFFFLVYCCV